jgi:hypothetical protein
MNLDAQIKGLVDDLPEPSRSQAVSALLRCNFVSVDDPTLGLLAVLKIRAQAKQPNNSAAPAHRAAERVEQVVWRLERWKWRNLLFSWIGFLALGICMSGGVLWFFAAKEPKTMQEWLRLRPPIEYRTVSDGRVLRLQENHVDWDVVDGGPDVGLILGSTAPRLERFNGGNKWVVVIPKKANE